MNDGNGNGNGRMKHGNGRIGDDRFGYMEAMNMATDSHTRVPIYKTTTIDHQTTTIAPINVPYRVHNDSTNEYIQWVIWVLQNYNPMISITLDSSSRIWLI
jgi:hypothetical protein